MTTTASLLIDIRDVAVLIAGIALILALSYATACALTPPSSRDDDA